MHPIKFQLCGGTASINLRSEKEAYLFVKIKDFVNYLFILSEVEATFAQMLKTFFKHAYLFNHTLCPFFVASVNIFFSQPHILSHIFTCNYVSSQRPILRKTVSKDNFGILVIIKRFIHFMMIYLFDIAVHYCF